MTGSKGDLVWVVTELSEAGETTVGVYDSMEDARAVIDGFGREHLHDYRVEGHVIGAGKTEPTPWHVGLTREGELLGVTPFIGCSCADDEDEYVKRSFIEDGGDRMYVMVLAPTPGPAITAAREYHTWLQERGHWSHERLQLHPLEVAAQQPAGA